MSIFRDIINKLLHRGGQQPQPDANAGSAQGVPAGVRTQPGGAPPQQSPSGAQGAGGQPATGAASAPAALSQLDVEGVMDKAAKEAGQPLNWRTSIVDTLKALGIDSSLEHRKALAKELDYTGDTNDSAAMNTWLHKRVMQELAKNGGKLPKDLTD